MARERRLQVEAAAIEIPLKSAMTITRGSMTSVRTVIVRVRDDEGNTGIGECAPIPRYDETVESVLACYAERFAAPVPFTDFDSLLDPLPAAARCGLDIALYDLLGRRLGAPLWEIFGADPAKLPPTSYTLYINDDVATTVRQAREQRDVSVLKIKLGLGRELETIAAVREAYSGKIRIDANEGWTPEQTVELLENLWRYDIEFCEQPIPAGSPAKLRWIRERSPVPIVVDEDSVDARDLGALIGCVDGVNVKLAKCGGIRAALAMIATARALGFKIMLGCMGESSVLITAAANLAPFVDYVDLDGNLLLDGDPFEGARYEAGRLTLPDRPGLGIVERVATR